MKTCAKGSLLLGLCVSSSAFAPCSTTTRSSVVVHETKEDLKELANRLNPVIGFWDPLGLADANFWGTSNEATIGFLRHAEIKHGRIAMFAFVGYVFHSLGLFRFPWAMQFNGTPFPSGTNPPELWDAVSDEAKLQIFLYIGFLEFWSERSTPDHKHYMAGGKPGDFPDFGYFMPLSLYDPLKLSKDMPKSYRERRLRVEINNGRLAMIAIIGCLSEQVLPGSVPVLTGVVPSYDGEIMAPFTENLVGTKLGVAWPLKFPDLPVAYQPFL